MSPVLLRPIFVADFSKKRNPFAGILDPEAIIYGDAPPSSSSRVQPERSTEELSELYNSIHSVSSLEGPEGFGRNSLITTEAQTKENGKIKLSEKIARKRIT